MGRIYEGRRHQNLWWENLHAGKGYQGLTVHELRHTVASLLVAEGLDVKTVQTQLGHKSASTTLNIYAHAFEERSREAGNTIGRLLNG
ncbi:hypothetical protein I0600191H4_00720 [Collinsella sp. i06-0019-1H4]|uniref:tyrosine-type recombinase/integrase n=1 Tax=Collinsella sp. i06-0019-1H4 TaxID=3132706 RepID=UPI0034B94718